MLEADRHHERRAGAFVGQDDFVGGRGWRRRGGGAGGAATRSSGRSVGSVLRAVVGGSGGRSGRVPPEASHPAVSPTEGADQSNHSPMVCTPRSIAAARSPGKYSGKTTSSTALQAPEARPDIASRRGPGQPMASPTGGSRTTTNAIVTTSASEPHGASRYRTQGPGQPPPPAPQARPRPRLRVKHHWHGRSARDFLWMTRSRSIRWLGTMGREFHSCSHNSAIHRVSSSPFSSAPVPLEAGAAHVYGHPLQSPPRASRDLLLRRHRVQRPRSRPIRHGLLAAVVVAPDESGHLTVGECLYLELRPDAPRHDARAAAIHGLDQDRLAREGLERVDFCTNSPSG